MCNEKEKSYADDLVFRAKKAAKAFETFTQDQVDRIVEAVYRAAFDARIQLAEGAIQETFLGDLKSKVQKNVFSSLIVYRDIRDKKTVGVIRRDKKNGTMDIAQPVGVVLNMTPITNPTSTVINKALICLKTRNPVIFSPHKAAKRCSRLAAQICYEAALKAGAPEDVIQWTKKSKWTYTQALMAHKGVDLVVATTAFHFVLEAYKSGNPCLGAGEGNVPVYIDSSADPDLAAKAIIDSKNFDYSTVCCSEQALVVTKDMDKKMREALVNRGAYFCNQEEAKRLGQIAFDPDRMLMRSDVVGQPAKLIAEKAQIPAPDGTKLLIGEVNDIGPEIPLSHEILAPIVCYHAAQGFDEALEFLKKVNQYHGKGHTLSIFTQDEAQVERLAKSMKCGRVLVNTPSSLGGLGGTFNGIAPSLTLSCGGSGKNFTSDNITVEHLLNINHVAHYSMDEAWKKIPGDAWLDPEFKSIHLDQ